MTGDSSPDKRALVARLLRERAARQQGAARAAHAALEMPPIVPQPSGGDVALSFAQERVWFVEQLMPESLFYNVLERWMFVGDLDVATLSRSIEYVVARHDVLRTVYPFEGGRPAPKITTAPAWSFCTEDLRSIPAGEREAEERRRSSDLGKAPFDLETGPLLRAGLFRLTDREFLFAIAAHHVLIDGRSLQVFIEEVAAAYDAFIDGREPALPPVAVQYADYARWQREWLSGEVLAAERRYWLEHLGAHPPELDLPADRPAPAARTFEGASHRVTMPRDALDELRALARREGVTLFMVLLAAFDALLERYSGQDEFVIGTLVAGRVRPEIQRAMGCFINTLAMRVDLSGDPTVRELLQRTRDLVIGAQVHESLPFERVVEEIRADRRLTGNPLAHVFLNMLNFGSRAEIALPNLLVRPIGGLDVHAVADQITLFVAEVEAGIEFNFVYASELFDAETIERMAVHFRAVLDAMMADPGRRLSEIALLDDVERDRIAAWNATARPYPLDRPLHHFIEAQVDRTPEGVAVTFEGTSLTYAELDARASQLAHHLAVLGVGPDVLVGVFMERSLEMVVALLGVLKAGGAYVPLDPTHPPERVAFMVADAEAPIVLTRERLRARLPESGARVIAVDAEWPSIARHPAARYVAPHTPEQLAYMIYTSGSTGRPKGALNTHRGIVNRLLWMQDAFGLTASDRVLQKTPFSFDVSVWEFFWPLMTGATLVVARPDGHRDAAYLAALIDAERITTAHFVPSMLAAFLDAGIASRLPSLRRVIASGEALTAELRDAFFARIDAELHNLYGPTEAAVDVTWWSCHAGDVGARVPIGRPIANTEIHVLDVHGRSAPIGVPGEIHIGGANVGRGYHRRSELTAQRFVTAPKGDPWPTRFRTGDVGRWRADGVLEYLGRMDGQVKLRGFRIELGEIESALRRHPTVGACVAVVRTEGPEPVLVAYVVPREDAPPLDAEALRMSLGTSLPSYMVPSAIVPLTALPLTPSGKIDRQALPPVAVAVARREHAPEPATPTERTIATIWREMLATDRVAADDDFFALGGSSLTATRVLARLHTILGVQLPVRAIFEAPTVRALAVRFDAAGAAGDPHGASVANDRLEITL